MTYENQPPPHRVPRAFLLRRLHSLTGFFFALFLCEHLITNSEAALWFGEDGISFVRSVNFLNSLPYLPLIELFLLGVPIAIHAILGIVYLLEAQCNSYFVSYARPYLPLPRNKAFTWQRITSVILVFGIIAHVFTMRFLNRPEENNKAFDVVVEADAGLATLAPRLNTTLILGQSKDTKSGDVAAKTWIAKAPDFGTATLLMVREAMRTPWICILYSIFVFAACFHAANGLWTCAIAWGAAMNEQGWKIVRLVSTFLGFVLGIGGLAAIWLTYWVNLRS